MHRCCAGVSVSHYAALSVSKDPFYCTVCCQQFMRETICSLCDTVHALQLKVAQLKAEKSLPREVIINSTDANDSADCSSNSHPVPPPPPSYASKASAHLASPTLSSLPARSLRDRKFNLVLYGIKVTGYSCARRHSVLHKGE